MASFGSLEPLARLDLRGRAGRFFALRFAMVGGILLQERQIPQRQPFDSFAQMQVSKHRQARSMPLCELNLFRINTYLAAA
jgi:hypothetical protein